MHLIDQFASPIIYAHRGASRYAPENTLAAFRLAYSMGTPAFELDTMLTGDGVPVVIHDDTLDRTTDGHGKVGGMSLSQIRQYDAGQRFSDEFRGEGIPTLEAVLDEFKGKMLINVELKNYSTPFDALPKRVAELARKMNNLDSLIFSSFQPLNLLRIKKLLPAAKTALLVDEGIAWRMLASPVLARLSPQYIHPHKSYITEKYLKDEHKRGRRVNTWTVNEIAEAELFFNWGIDGLITDDPKAMLELLAHFH
ncbi:MAG: glycerophosphodiester phosphodiesterase [Anaerolineae bacterium]|nr:glycerophosphodiester phosphodiesterase [Anaerolineae bacterium]